MGATPLILRFATDYGVLLRRLKRTRGTSYTRRKTRRAVVAYYTRAHRHLAAGWIGQDAGRYGTTPQRHHLAVQT